MSDSVFRFTLCAIACGLSLPAFTTDRLFLEIGRVLACDRLHSQERVQWALAWTSTASSPLPSPSDRRTELPRD